MRLGFGPLGWDLSNEAGIWASRRRFGPSVLDMGLRDWFWALGMVSEPNGWELGFEIGIWGLTLRFGPQGLEFGPQGRDLSLEARF